MAIRILINDYSFIKGRVSVIKNKSKNKSKKKKKKKNGPHMRIVSTFLREQ